MIHGELDATLDAERERYERDEVSRWPAEFRRRRPEYPWRNWAYTTLAPDYRAQIAPHLHGSGQSERWDPTGLDARGAFEIIRVRGP